MLIDRIRTPRNTNRYPQSEAFFLDFIHALFVYPFNLVVKYPLQTLNNKLTDYNIEKRPYN